MAIAGMGWLLPQPGAAEALGILRGAGARTLALSNGSLPTTRALLERAGVAPLFDAVLSVEEVGLPKPRAEAYLAAAGRLGVSPPELMLVASHPWDIQSAAAAGLQTGYVSPDASFPSCFEPPQHRAPDLCAIARLIVARQDGQALPVGSGLAGEELGQERQQPLASGPVADARQPALAAAGERRLVRPARQQRQRESGPDSRQATDRAGVSIIVWVVRRR